MLRAITYLARRLRRDNGGASAIEFAVFTPVLAFSALAMIDVGLAIGERMDLNHVLRAGAESAMQKHEADKIATIMQASVSNGATVGVTADKYCACSDAPTTPVACSNICTGGLPPLVFVDLTANQTVSNIFIPDINFSADMRVQLR